MNLTKQDVIKFQSQASHSDSSKYCRPNIDTTQIMGSCMSHLQTNQPVIFAPASNKGIKNLPEGVLDNYVDFILSIDKKLKKNCDIFPKHANEYSLKIDSGNRHINYVAMTHYRYLWTCPQLVVLGAYLFGKQKYSSAETIILLAAVRSQQFSQGSGNMYKCPNGKAYLAGHGSHVIEHTAHYKCEGKSLITKLTNIRALRVDTSMQGALDAKTMFNEYRDNPKYIEVVKKERDAQTTYENYYYSTPTRLKSQKKADELINALRNAQSDRSKVYIALKTAWLRTNTFGGETEKVTIKNVLDKRFAKNFLKNFTKGN